MKKKAIVLAMGMAMTLVSVFAGCGSVCTHSNMKVDSTTATCVSAGVETLKCSDCDYTETREVNAYGHQYETRDKDGNVMGKVGENNYGFGVNRFCRRCDETQFSLTSNNTLPLEITSSFYGEKESGIKIKSFEFQVDHSGEWFNIVITCEKTADYTNKESYAKVLALQCTITDTVHPEFQITQDSVYSELHGYAAQDEIEVGEEFILPITFSLTKNSVRYTPSSSNGDYPKGNFVISFTQNVNIQRPLN